MELTIRGWVSSTEPWDLWQWRRSRWFIKRAFHLSVMLPVYSAISHHWWDPACEGLWTGCRTCCCGAYPKPSIGTLWQALRSYWMNTQMVEWVSLQARPCLSHGGRLSELLIKVLSYDVLAWAGLQWILMNYFIETWAVLSAIVNWL